MTNQEIFDKSVEHLRKQRRKSIDYQSSACRYRLGELMCAVGPFIPENSYSKDMEGKGVVALLNMFPEVRMAIFGDSDYLKIAGGMSLLANLQEIHDSYPEHNWEARWKDLAERFELTYTPPEEK